MFRFILPLLLATVFQLHGVESTFSKISMNNLNTLQTKLLKGYNKNTLPASNFSEPFEVFVWASVTSFGEIDEVEEKLSTVVHFVLQWNDVSIRWNQDEYDGTKEIVMRYQDVWTPNFILLNPHAEYFHQLDDMESRDHTQNGTSCCPKETRKKYEETESAKMKTKIQDKYVVFLNSGNAHVTLSMTLQTSCDIDTTFYPFDTQTCIIYLGLAQGIIYKIRVVGLIENTPRDFTTGKEVKENGAWSLIEQRFEDSNNSALVIIFKVKRKPMFAMLNIVLPVVALAVITPLVFLIHKTYGGRIGYSVTMLFAISVYMTIISDRLPEKSDPLPLISLALFVLYVLSSFIVFIVIIIERITHNKDERPVPHWLQVFVTLTHKIKLHVRMSNNKEKSKQIIGDICQGNADVITRKQDAEDEITETELDSKRPKAEKQKPVVSSVTWEEVRSAVDSWWLVFCYTVVLVLPIVFGILFSMQS